MQKSELEDDLKKFLVSVDPMTKIRTQEKELLRKDYLQKRVKEEKLVFAFEK